VCLIRVMQLCRDTCPLEEMALIVCQVFSSMRAKRPCTVSVLRMMASLMQCEEPSTSRIASAPSLGGSTVVITQGFADDAFADAGRGQTGLPMVPLWAPRLRVQVRRCRGRGRGSLSSLACWHQRNGLRLRHGRLLQGHLRGQPSSLVAGRRCVLGLARRM
jgi:hypothetical protein